MEKSAVFSDQLDIDSFLRSKGSATIDLVKNPKPQKVFFATNNGITGRVSNKVSAIDGTLFVSMFTPEEGEPSWMLHTSDKSNVVSSYSPSA